MKTYVYGVVLTRADAAGVTTREYYATASMHTDATHPIAPNTYIDGRLKQPGDLHTWLWGERRTRGPREVSSGYIELENVDRALDGLVGYAMDGRLMVIWREEVGNPASAQVVFPGWSEQAEGLIDTVRVYWRDFAHIFDKPVCDKFFTGGNVAPDGLEGSAELTGLPKPKLLGYAFNVEPILVNASRLIFQISDRNGVQFTGGVVRDAAVALGQGVQRTLTDMQAGAAPKTVSGVQLSNDILTTSVNHGFTTGQPAHLDTTDQMPNPLVTTQQYYVRVVSATQVTLHPTAADAVANTNKVNILDAGSGVITISNNRTAKSQWDWCDDAAGAYIRLGTKPVGRITCDFAGGFASGDFTNGATRIPAAGGVPAGETTRILTTLAGWAANNAPADFSSITLDFSAFAAAEVSDNGGTYVADAQTTYLDVFNRLAGSWLASWSLVPALGNLAGNFTLKFKYLTEPSASAAVLDVDDSMILVQGDGPSARSTLQREVSADEDRGLPCWRFTLSYYRNEVIQDRAELPNRSDDVIALYGQQWQRALTSSDAAVKTQWPRSEALLVERYNLTHGLHFTDLLARMRALYKVRRAMYSFELSDDDAAALSLGDVLQLKSMYFGLQAGQKFIVIGKAADLQQGKVRIYVWG